MKRKRYESIYFESHPMDDLITDILDQLKTDGISSEDQGLGAAEQVAKDSNTKLRSKDIQRIKSILAQNQRLGK